MHASRRGPAGPPGERGDAVAARLVLALAFLGGVARLLWLAGPGDLPRSVADLPRWLATPPAGARVAALATLTAWGCLAWLGLALVAVAARSPSSVRLPRALRRAAERALGVAAASAAAGVLVASPAVADGPFDRAADPPRGAPSAAPVVVRAPVLVARGDTLWGIAARALGARASPHTVATAWPRWYAANRAVVGPDPDLVKPGQRLRPPVTDLRACLTDPQPAARRSRPHVAALSSSPTAPLSAPPPPCDPPP